MAKVITYSRRFPATHARKGQPTHFVEKFLASIGVDTLDATIFNHCNEICTGGYSSLRDAVDIHDPKHHTIRKGNRWKVGEMFSPRIWSESPYHSPMIKIGPDMPVLKTWDIHLDLVPPIDPNIDPHARFFDVIRINGVQIDNDKNAETIEKLAKNDGLSVEDFRSWFAKPFDGQIICWNAEIEY